MMQRSLVCTLWLVASSAYAQPRTKPAEVTRYEFGDQLVPGDLLRPDGILLQTRGPGQRSSLVEVRESFVPELLKAVEDL